MDVQFQGYVQTNQDSGEAVISVRNVQVKGENVKVASFTISHPNGKNEQGKSIYEYIKVTLWGEEKINYCIALFENYKYVFVKGRHDKAMHIWDQGDKKGINFDVTADIIAPVFFNGNNGQGQTQKTTTTSNKKDVVGDAADVVDDIPF